ncbi:MULTISPECIES: fructose-specific PTS transporter subunit EIIC [unclassified Arthrobacter]|uniref:PTS fructose transporter subunit IIABC n=1 Tax=unclassified Arthrobacter TaxID=235627 RepID=UPI00159DF943|nr:MULTISPECIES: fructose-specific PTS transporter subunit EIIC [unclassified Arthrobacter]MCQ9162616.1 fructose-specific PTS transporter subunit EIIC [Arthrobacter sp. STN4]NVM97401.1 PTS transporter subunit EIIA [Arthrobacter sp. SDTb3-6]
MTTLINTDLVVLDANLGADTSAVIRNLAGMVAGAGRATGVDGLYADALAREQKTATGVPGGIAIPHCRSESVLEATLAMARLAPAVDFGAKDGPADIVFFIAAPAGADNEHLKLLSKLARSLIKKDFTAALRAAATPAEIVALVDGALAEKPADVPAAAPAAAAATPAPAAAAPKRLVAVTACPTGIAHTYMAADSLVEAAREAGIELQVETQGSGAVTPLDPAVIAAADAVIFAVDVDVRGKERFAGKPVINAPVKRGIDEPAKMIQEALAAATDPHAHRVPHFGAEEAAEHNAEVAGEHLGTKVKKVLLTGVSYMIPFVAGGGLLIALGFLLGGYGLGLNGQADHILANNTLLNLPDGGNLLLYLGAVAFKIGGLSMGFLVPALAGYIAFGIADRPGIAPGFTAGAVAVFMGAGFLGGLVGGLLAGLAAYWIGTWQVPRWLRGLMPVVIIPLLGSIIASGAMLLFLGGPIAALSNGLNHWLTGMSGASAVVLGIILGLMMCFDLGGPVNKVAYAFAVAGLGAGSALNHAPWEIMAAVMAAGMVPPLAMALATVLDKKRFSLAERENGKAAWLLGASFISEGAIPFAAADPFRVIPATMLGGAVTGALSMAFHVTSQAPHGGIFVFFAIGNVGMFFGSILVGTVVAALAVVALKRWAVRKPVDSVAAPELVRQGSY